MARERAGSPERAVLVVACGNPLRGDDAAGPEVAELLAAELEGAGVSLIVTDQLLPELAEDASRARRVVFIDAAADRPAGSVAVAPVAARQRAPDPPAGSAAVTASLGWAARALEPFSHGMAPADVLALARDLYAATPEAVVVSVGAASFEPGAPLSAAVRRALPSAARAARGAALVGANPPEDAGA
jgi:Ni,Fe-hydrogenase maturation factor